MVAVEGRSARDETTNQTKKMSIEKIQSVIFSSIQGDLMGEQFEVVRDVFFAELEGRETIEVCLWNGFSLADVSGDVHLLDIVAEGDDEYGRVYTLAVRI